MAWTDSCKIEACAQIDKRKDEVGGIRPAIKALSKESGIPEGTLREWYYPRDCRKTPTHNCSAYEAIWHCVTDGMGSKFDIEKEVKLINAVRESYKTIHALAAGICTLIEVIWEKRFSEIRVDWDNIGQHLSGNKCTCPGRGSKG